MTVTYSETYDLPAGLGLTGPRHQRRTLRAWFGRALTRLRVGYALSAVRADLKRMPTFVLNDIGIPADEIDRITRAARHTIIRSAVRSKLDRTGPSNGGRVWTS